MFLCKGTFTPGNVALILRGGLSLGRGSLGVFIMFSVLEIPHLAMNTEYYVLPLSLRPCIKHRGSNIIHVRSERGRCALCCKNITCILCILLTISSFNFEPYAPTLPAMQFYHLRLHLPVPDSLQASAQCQSAARGSRLTAYYVLHWAQYAVLALSWRDPASHVHMSLK